MNETHPVLSRRRLLFIGSAIIIGVVVLVSVIFIVRTRSEQQEMVSNQRLAAAGPRTPYVVVTRSPAVETLVLSGETHPFLQVTLYAKVSGYLRRIPVDKGDYVSRGQLLAEIEAPELDRQYDAAVADARNKRVFAEREKGLVKNGSVAKQDYDSAEAAAQVAEATAQSLKSQKGYEIIRAPFSGIVTARFVDPGALLQSATTAQTSAQPVVTLSQTDRLRVYVYVDQRNAAFVKRGDRAVISDATRPEVRLPARVSRISGQLDEKTRTLLVELGLDNRAGEILAGGYVQVSLTFRTPSHVQVPANALLMRGDKTFVGVVGNDSRVRFRQVTVVDSDGKAVRLDAGLGEGERVVLNPGTGIHDGELIQPVGASER
jgi:membrane fusion protein, multidrug efflux system